MQLREVQKVQVSSVRLAKGHDAVLYRPQETCDGRIVNERELGSRYLKKFHGSFKGAFVYRIADSPVCRKPFDAFILLDGKFTAVEFKVEPNDLEPHQRKALMDVKRAGGEAKVIYFDKAGKVSKEVTL